MDKLVGSGQTPIPELPASALAVQGSSIYPGVRGAARRIYRNEPNWMPRSASKGPAEYHRRVFPTLVGGLRADMTNQWNANLLREFPIKERARPQLRLDALNLQNRSQFAGPNVNPYSTNFGVVTSQTATHNRFIQIQGRIRF